MLFLWSESRRETERMNTWARDSVLGADFFVLGDVSYSASQNKRSRDFAFFLLGFASLLFWGVNCSQGCFNPAVLFLAKLISAYFILRVTSYIPFPVQSQHIWFHVCRMYIFPLQPLLCHLVLRLCWRVAWVLFALPPEVIFLKFSSRQGSRKCLEPKKLKTLYFKVFP